MATPQTVKCNRFTATAGKKKIMDVRLNAKLTMKDDCDWQARIKQ